MKLHDIIVRHLADQQGEWVMGYDLEKVNTRYGWIGSSGQRRCRELAEQGTHKIGNIEYKIESQKMGKYVQYRVADERNTTPQYRMEIRNGERVMCRV